MYQRMTDREIDWAERIKTLLGWRYWKPGVDGCVYGHRGRRLEVITISGNSDARIREQIVRVLEQRNNQPVRKHAAN